MMPLRGVLQKQPEKGMTGKRRTGERKRHMFVVCVWFFFFFFMGCFCLGSKAQKDTLQTGPKNRTIHQQHNAH
jgi:hypothetical protein